MLLNTEDTAPNEGKPFRAEGGDHSLFYFETLPQAQQWLKTHGSGTIKERRLIDWAFPIDRKVQVPTWVRVE